MMQREVHPVFPSHAGASGPGSHPRRVEHAIDHPIKESVQKDGRIRRWTCVTEMDGKYLRVILLPDKETVHNAFFDRSFKP
jgi:hypothetical protein